MFCLLYAVYLMSFTSYAVECYSVTIIVFQCVIIRVICQFFLNFVFNYSFALLFFFLFVVYLGTV